MAGGGPDPGFQPHRARAGAGFVVPDLAGQVARAAQGELDRIATGNLEVSRDMTDVRDIVRAYRLLMVHGEPGGVYNVCRGEAVLISDLLRRLMEHRRYRRARLGGPGAGQAGRCRRGVGGPQPDPRPHRLAPGHTSGPDAGRCAGQVRAVTELEANSRGRQG